MLLGCCHCEEESSSSESSSSEPSESSSSSEVPSSEASSSRELINCLACLALPLRWKVTGIDRSKVTYVPIPDGSGGSVDCSASFEDGLICDLAFMSGSIGGSGSICVRWESQARLINHRKLWQVISPPSSGPFDPSCQPSNNPLDTRLFINFRRVGPAGVTGTTIRIQVGLGFGSYSQQVQTSRYATSASINWGGPGGFDFVLTGRNCLRQFVVPGPNDINVPNGIYDVTSTAGNSGPITLTPA